MTFEQAFSFDSLYAAHIKCRKCKQHKKDTVNFEINLGPNLVALSKEILDGAYKIERYKRFFVHEPKTRMIEALPYKDRVVLMALCDNIIEPRLERRLIHDNVACRIGKGTHFGHKRLGEFLRAYHKKHGNKGYVLKCDIRKYFASVGHEVLKAKLRKAGFSEREMALIDMIIDSKALDEGAEIGKGMPIGNQTSQWFALFYLDEVDRIIKEKLGIRYYIRYMDDLVIIHHDKEYLKQCKEVIRDTLVGSLKLTPNKKLQISRLDAGVGFLGFSYKLLGDGKVLRLLRGDAKKRLKRNTRRLAMLRDTGIADRDYIAVRVAAYKAHTDHGDAERIRRATLDKYDLDALDVSLKRK